MNSANSLAWRRGNLHVFNYLGNVMFAIHQVFEYATLAQYLILRMHMEPSQTSQDNRAYFEANIESCLDRLYGAALRLTRNPADAEDLVAETVTRGLNKIDSLKDCERMIYWLLRIMSNHFISTIMMQFSITWKVAVSATRVWSLNSV